MTRMNGEGPTPPNPENNSPLFGAKAPELRQLVEQCRRVHGDVSPETANALVMLGDAYSVEGLASRAEAVVAYEQALAAYGSNAAAQAAIYEKLAQSERQAANFPGAADYTAKAVECWKRDPVTSQDSALISAKEEKLRELQQVARVQKPGSR